MDLELDTPYMQARIADGVGWMTFNNPDRRNAMSLEMWEAVGEIMTNFIPKTGRLVLTSMVTHDGKINGDFTIACAGVDRTGPNRGNERFQMWGSSQAQIYHCRNRIHTTT